MNVPGKPRNLVALLEDEGPPIKVPDRLVHTAMKTRIISVPASRDEARGALGEVLVDEHLVQAGDGKQANKPRSTMHFPLDPKDPRRYCGQVWILNTPVFQTITECTENPVH